MSSTSTSYGDRLTLNVGQPGSRGLRRPREVWFSVFANKIAPWQSPTPGMADLSARASVRVLSPDEIERMLADHRLYQETEYHQGHRANFSSTDLTGRDFSGLNLRGIKMDRAVLKGADFSGAHLQSANLIGGILREACFDRADLSGRV